MSVLLSAPFSEIPHDGRSEPNAKAATRDSHSAYLLAYALAQSCYMLVHQFPNYDLFVAVKPQPPTSASISIESGCLATQNANVVTTFEFLVRARYLLCSKFLYICPTAKQRPVNFWLAHFDQTVCSRSLRPPGNSDFEIERLSLSLAVRKPEIVSPSTLLPMVSVTERACILSHDLRHAFRFDLGFFNKSTPSPATSGLKFRLDLRFYANLNKSTWRRMSFISLVFT
ncbi:hypothetical protein C8R45DRAFT_931059 [Mycena sanguinolenta]|nr:hypothetical protein C8R45DRAFT_931059 [Mycena sanguinolenta]